MYLIKLTPEEVTDFNSKCVYTKIHPFLPPACVRSAFIGNLPVIECTWTNVTLCSASNPDCCQKHEENGAKCECKPFRINAVLNPAMLLCLL